MDLGRKNVNQEEFEDDDSDGPEEVSYEIEVEESENVNKEAVIKSENEVRAGIMEEHAWEKF